MTRAPRHSPPPTPKIVLDQRYRSRIMQLGTTENSIVQQHVYKTLHRETGYLNI